MTMTEQEATKVIFTALDTHKAQDIRVLEVSQITSLADRFIIASGTSTTQVKALADYVEEALVHHGVQALRTEGYATAQWALLDYGSVVVHVFLNTARTFYDLERLWQDAGVLDLAEFLEDESNEKI